MKTILGNFVFINEENKNIEIQCKNVLSFTKFILGVFVRGVGLGGCPGGFVRGFIFGGFLSCHLLSLLFVFIFKST